MWWTREGRWLALIAPALVFAGLALYGAASLGIALAMIFLASLLVWMALASSGRRRELSALGGIGLPAFLFAAVVIVIALSLTPYVPGGPHPVWAHLGLTPGAGSLDKSVTLIELLRLLGLGSIFGLGLVAGASNERARLALDVILALGAAVMAWSFADLMAGGQGLGRQRIDGPFDSANTMATLAGVLLMIAVSRTTSRFREGGFVAASAHASAALVMLVTLLATASRGGAIAAAAGLAAFAILQIFVGRLSLTRAALASLGALAVIAAFLIAGADLLVDRLVDQQMSSDDRQTTFSVHWKMFEAAPLMGHGLGTFDIVNRTVLDASNFQHLWNSRFAHNVYLSWLEQAGLIGAVPMFACIAALLAITLRNTLQRRRTNLLFGLMAANVVVLVHGMTDFALEIYAFAALWALLLGVQFSLAQASGRR